MLSHTSWSDFFICFSTLSVRLLRIYSLFSTMSRAFTKSLQFTIFTNHILCPALASRGLQAKNASFQVQALFVKKELQKIRRFSGVLKRKFFFRRLWPERSGGHYNKDVSSAFSSGASHPCPVHRGRCARQWCSRSAAGPLHTALLDTWRAGLRGSASTGACLRLHRSHSPP